VNFVVAQDYAQRWSIVIRIRKRGSSSSSSSSSTSSGSSGGSCGTNSSSIRKK
jgi:hypothetical protein